MRILVAEDGTVSRRLLVAQLQKMGHEVIAAPDGTKALAALKAPQRPRVAILDWNMPGANGPAICREVRHLPLEQYIYTFLLTVRGRPQDLAEGFESGADDFLVKPINFDELRARLSVAERVLELRVERARMQVCFETVAESVDSGIALWDPRGRVTFANQAQAALTGTERSLVGMDRGGVLGHFAGRVADFASFARELALPPNADMDATLAADIDIDLPERRSLRWMARRLRFPDGLGWLEINQDVTAQVELGRALQGRSERDTLTGLPNRLGAIEAIGRELARSRRDRRGLSVALVDIDGFTHVNSSLGRGAGERVLKEVAREVVTTLRPYDIVARWGDEEFLILLPGAHVDGAANAMERVRTRVEALSISGASRVTVSAGVDELAEAEHSVEAALLRSDRKLSWAKTNGRNQVCGALP
jgi:two-component system, cell cycle response regulator